MKALASEENGAVQITLDSRLYRLVAVQKVAYRFADRCTAVFETLDTHSLTVSLAFRQETSEPVVRETVRHFYQELLDQELREQVGDETRALRALILAQAFSRTGLIRQD